MEPQSLQAKVSLFCRAVEEGIQYPALGEAGLTANQFACLRYIALHPQPSVVDVSKGLGITTAAATPLVDRLVKKDLIIRNPDPDDRRVVRLLLTESGVALFGQVQRAQNAALLRLFERMGGDACGDLQRGIDSFVGACVNQEQWKEEFCLHCGTMHHNECPVYAARKERSSSFNR